MNDALSNALDHLASPLQHTTDELVELNERIARLARLMHLQLNHERDLDAVLASASSAQPRLQELRGLLVMRYRLERQLSITHGGEVMRKTLQGVEQAMLARGFQPGQDGIVLGRNTEDSQGWKP